MRVAIRIHYIRVTPRVAMRTTARLDEGYFQGYIKSRDIVKVL